MLQGTYNGFFQTGGVDTGHGGAQQSLTAEITAQKLHKAMKGLGTDEKAIIDVMASHTNKQRQEIALAYEKLYDKHLRAELKSEISGNFENLVLALLETPANNDAKEIKFAIKGAGTDEGTLIEILSSRSNAQLEAIKQAYKTLFKSSIDNDITRDTSGHFQSFLVSQLSARRNEKATFYVIAAEDAKELFDAVKAGTIEATFNRILSLRSFPQLVVTFDAYRTLNNGKEIADAIKGATRGDLRDGYMAVLKLTQNVPAYFAERLYNSMKGLGTTDSTLIRIIVTRSEIDMVQIKSEFQRLYGKSLASFIKGDTSGDYEMLLLALIKEK